MDMDLHRAHAAECRTMAATAGASLAEILLQLAHELEEQADAHDRSSTWRLAA